MKSYQEITKELAKKDLILAKAIETVEKEIKPSPDIDVYYSLLNSIVSQQLSVKVAQIIWRRLTLLFHDQYPNAKQILLTEDEDLRAIGLSRQKIKYINNVAQFSLDNDISFEYLNKKTDDEIISYLSQIVGIGKWTVQMILMFPMDRLNIFPVDDLGIQTKMKAWYNIDLEKKELRNKLVEIAEKWHPYKTLASKYIWESVI
ncbi:MAG: DNA-3-methyladenine glycosylase 2 family protein [Bacteroidales bacterium]|nr:DNA-3-methyladenine glycosylase 2 family protein [Bacteroidales bacterium]MBN2756053.1 DNA-3-methyladenine glycosylase 2 family protein [Bacteroidales bacterium]